MATGRGVRVAIVDSGVHASHPHVGAIAGGVAIDEHGGHHGDFVDRLGHGTAVTAAIREKAADAELFAVKVFDRTLSTSIASLVDGIDWAAQNGMHLVNLSLGTPRREHEAALTAAIARAASANLLVVAAREDAGVRWLPGTLAGVLPVEIDWTLSRDTYRSARVDGVTVFYTSGFPREIPGVPPERNLHGISFAVANMTGHVACAIEGASDRSLASVIARL
jgi:subtilisin family serine protease